MWNRLLFATSRSDDLGRGALQKAVRLAIALDAELQLARCAFDTELAQMSRTDQEAQAEIRRTLEQQRAELEREADRIRARNVRVRTSVRWDYPPSDGIVRQVLHDRPDLLIVPTTRQDPASQSALTYTDFRLIETCPSPLLLVKSLHAYANVRIVAAVDPLHAYDKPASLDEAILMSAKQLSNALSGTLVLFHARLPWSLVSRAIAAASGRHGPTQSEAEYDGRVRGQLNELARRHNLPDAAVHVLEGDPAECLPEFAHAQSAEIVALGAVSRSLLKRILIGHTAERLLDALQCDLLITKSPRFRSSVSLASDYDVDGAAAESGETNSQPF